MKSTTKSSQNKTAATTKSSQDKSVTTEPTAAKEILLAEYEEVGHNWRFFIGLRATTFSGFLTVNTTLAAVTGWLLGSRMEINKALIISAIALIAIISTIASGLTEYRIWLIFNTCHARAIEVENLLSIEGLYHKVSRIGPGPKGRWKVVTYTKVMILILLLNLLMWGGMLLYSERVVTATKPLVPVPSASPVQQ